MSAAAAFRAAAAERILVKDGAYGTRIQGEGLKEADYRGHLELNHCTVGEACRLPQLMLMH